MNNWTRIDTIFLWVVLLGIFCLLCVHTWRVLNATPQDDPRIQLDGPRLYIEDFEPSEIRVTDTLYLTSNSYQLYLISIVNSYLLFGITNYCPKPSPPLQSK